MENNTRTEVNYRWVIEREVGSYPNATVSFTSTACFHCADPACMPACPVEAITKDAESGIVLIEQDTCIGCKYCMAACPYGAPQFNAATGKVEKCTYCIERYSDGLGPACARTCVGGAIRAVTDEDWGGTPPEGFAPINLTGPSVKFEG